MADISKIKASNNTSYNLKDAYVRTELLNKATKVELTQAQYNALSYAQKHNGTIYFITDA